MDTDEGFKCDCGRSFPTHPALTTHKRSCSNTKKRLSNALSSGRDTLLARKRRRADALLDVNATVANNALENSSGATADVYEGIIDTVAHVVSWKHSGIFPLCNY